MRVLVACEFSGIVRDCFSALGHDAWSCDLLDCEKGGNHFKCDVREILDLGWDLMIAHPPCTYLSVSGNRWLREEPFKQHTSSVRLELFGEDENKKEKSRQENREESIEFVSLLMGSLVPRICIENPVGVLSSRIRKPDQIIQPWQFGHGETKATCLWLKNLPKLIPTNVVDGRLNRVHREGPHKDRWKNRSRTMIGIAEAMASQWGSIRQNELFTNSSSVLNLDLF